MRVRTGSSGRASRGAAACGAVRRLRPAVWPMRPAPRRGPAPPPATPEPPPPPRGGRGAAARMVLEVEMGGGVAGVAGVAHVADQLAGLDPGALPDRVARQVRVV